MPVRVSKPDRNRPPNPNNMAKHHHAAFTRQLTERFNEAQARQHRAILEFEKLGRQPKNWPPQFLSDPLEAFLIEQATRRVPQCNCMRLSCKFCGFVAFHARVRSVERPYLTGGGQ
jgi:hypothetical protein